MTDRPILFSAPMVRALLDGRKTQTRRIAKITAVMGNKVAIESPDEKLIELEDGEFRRGFFHYESTSALSGQYRLPCAVGDRLWVRETWCYGPAGQFADAPIYYRATDNDVEGCAGYTKRGDRRSPWRPSIHMPRRLSRLTLAVTDVRVQRLQEISESDACAEGATARDAVIDIGGMSKGWCMDWSQIGTPSPFDRSRTLRGHDIALGTPRMAFANYWESLHGAGAWDANPWIVALAFEVERRNIDDVTR